MPCPTFLIAFSHAVAYMHRVRDFECYHNSTVESLYKESSAMRGLKVWKQNGVQVLSIEKTQVLTMHE